jgi:hypothetical protein
MNPAVVAQAFKQLDDNHDGSIGGMLALWAVMTASTRPACLWAGYHFPTWPVWEDAHCACVADSELPSRLIAQIEALDGHDDSDDGKLSEVEITIAIRAVVIIYADFVVRCPEAKPEPEIEYALAYGGTSEEYRGRVKPEKTLVTRENKYEGVCYAWAAEDWSIYSKCKPACGLSLQTRTRNVKCQLRPEYVMGVPESILFSDKCTGHLKPAATEDRDCNDFSLAGCTDDQCYWETGDWSNYTTPAGCGKVNRTRSRSVQCMKNGKKADESCCEKWDKASDDAKKTGKFKPMSVQTREWNMRAEFLEEKREVEGCNCEVYVAR